MVCERLGIAGLHLVDDPRRRRLLQTCDAGDLLGVLTRLFVLGGLVPENETAGVLGANEAAAMRSAGLTGVLVRVPGSEPFLYSPVRLVPLGACTSPSGTLLIASDRTDNPDASEFEGFTDMVFSGHNALTRQFLRLLPLSRTGAVLDLCAGTGVAALAVAGTAGSVVAVDLTERSIEFARFNCWLNDAAGIDLRQGDMFQPVYGERFDRILAHPPYVPSLFESEIYRDGGETGDRLLRQIVAGLPAHLNPGGTFHVLTMGMDTTEGPFEARVRDWLGPAAAEFDVVFGINGSKTPEEFARTAVAKVAGSEPGDYDRWMALLQRAGTRAVVYGALVGRRLKPSEGDPQTRRVPSEPTDGPEGFEWLLGWFDWLRRPDRRERVLSSRPVLPAYLRMEVHHDVEEGQFVPRTFRLSNEGRPFFKVHLETDGWVVALMNQFDGRTTVGEVHAAAARYERIPPEFDAAEMVELVCLLAERGLLCGISTTKEVGE